MCITVWFLAIFLFYHPKPTLKPSYVHEPNFKTQVCSSKGKYFTWRKNWIITVRRKLRNVFMFVHVICTGLFVNIIYFSTYFHIYLTGTFVNRWRI
jgi:hypothetical protein